MNPSSNRQTTGTMSHSTAELVERLRAIDNREDAWLAIEEAADRLEHLERALTAIVDFQPVKGPIDPHSQIAVFAKQTACSALTQTDNSND